MATIEPQFLALASSWKQPISSAWSFPVKTRELDRGLAGIPMAGQVAVVFSSGYKLAKEWADTGRYTLIEAGYGFPPVARAHPWSVNVLPVPRSIRHQASTLLLTSGLVVLRNWFFTASTFTGTEGGASLVLSFQPGEPQLVETRHSNLSPRVEHA
jgi:hypothetical protein